MAVKEKRSAKSLNKLNPQIVYWSVSGRYKTDAKVALHELQRIRKAYGLEDGDSRALQEAIIREARSPANPLHHDFEWDDSVAAHAHRKSRAAAMMGHLKVVWKENPDREYRYFQRITVAKQGPAGPRRVNVYKTTDEVLNNQDLRSELLSRARAELTRFRRRYYDLVELANVLNSIDEFLEHDAAGLG